MFSDILLNSPNGFTDTIVVVCQKALLAPEETVRKGELGSRMLTALRPEIRSKYSTSKNYSNLSEKLVKAVDRKDRRAAYPPTSPDNQILLKVQLIWLLVIFHLTLALGSSP